MTGLPTRADRVWRVGTVDERSAAELARGASISPLLARLLLVRGVRSVEAAKRFLDPALEDLHDPRGLKGLEEAVDRLLAAVDRGERILVYGDYDVDGVTAVAQLRAALGRLGGKVEAFIPHRLRDGYGLRPATVERILERRPGVLVTVDCGISAVEGVRRAAEAGIDVIITDHHIPPEALPSNCVIVNAKQPGCLYPYKELCGSGVAFKIVQELSRRRPKTGDPRSYLRLAVLGTVADVVPLDGENRTISRLGAIELVGARSPGLRSLLRKVGILGRIPSGYDLGFRVGPRLNAAGRIDVAGKALELLETRDESRADEIASELDELNRQRQEEERRVVAAARERILADEKDPAHRAGLLAAGDGWHRGVLGIAASRLAREFNRPVVLLSIEDGQASGSGRSIPGISLHACLAPHRALLRDFGGHDAACGLSLDAGRIAELAELFDRTVAECHGPADFEPVLEIDMESRLEELVRLETLAELAKLEPTGQSNPRPSFFLSGLRAGALRQIQSGRSLAGRLSQGKGTEAPFVFWDPPPAEKGLVEAKDGEFEAAVRVEEDRYFTPARPRLEVLSVRPSGSER